jgi:type VI protein secretion system component VasF
MTPSEACEPIFLYMCRLNRGARVPAASAALEHTRVRAEIRGLFEQLHDACARDAELRLHFDDSGGKLERVMVYFVDAVVTGGRLPFAIDWELLEQERYGEAVGDDQFWELLERALRDTSQAAGERLKVFYACLGLGFTGRHVLDPEYVAGKIAEVKRRLASMDRAREGGLLFPDNYDRTDTSNLYEPPGSKLRLWGLGLAGLAVVVFVTILALFAAAVSDINTSMAGINTSGDGLASSTDGARGDWRGLTSGRSGEGGGS